MKKIQDLRFNLTEDMNNVNGKIKCRKSVNLNVGFPTFYITINIYTNICFVTYFFSTLSTFN